MYEHLCIRMPGSIKYIEILFKKEVSLEVFAKANLFKSIRDIVIIFLFCKLVINIKAYAY